MDGKSMPDAPVSEKALSAAQAWWNGTEGLRYAEFPDLAQAFARFEAKVRRETIEQCAKVADTIAERHGREWKTHYRMHDQGCSDGADEVAEAIRAILDGEAG